MKISVPSKLLQRVEQRVNARHVQMRRRLVHQQQVRRIEQQFHQREPAFFAAAQDADLFENVVAAKQKAAEQRADELLRDALRRVQRFLEHRCDSCQACRRGTANSNRP